MKQLISIGQWNSISGLKKYYFQNGKFPKEGDAVGLKNYTFPSIGKMIEFLDKEVGMKEVNWAKVDNLCNLLWRATKQILKLRLELLEEKHTITFKNGSKIDFHNA